MEFMQRGNQTRTNSVSRSGGVVGNGGHDDDQVDEGRGKRFGRSGNGGGSGKRLGLVAGILVAVIAVAAIAFFCMGKGSAEQKFVEKDQLQAVFINVNGTNGGQVYFGNIKELNQQFIKLTNVFYIQNQQSTNNQQNNSAYNLVKLGCELHGPDDQMIINRSEVFFWENLKADSQVAQKVAEFEKQNPGGQKCNASNSTGTTGQQSTGTQTTGGNTTNAGTGTGTTNNNAATGNQ